MKIKILKDILIAKSWLWEFRQKVVEGLNYTRAYAHKKYGGVSVLVVDNKNRVALIKIFRLPLEKEVWEIVRGSGEPNMSFEEVAKKEVEEELGIPVKKLKKLGAIYPDSGFIDWEVGIYLAQVDDFQKYDVWGKYDGSYELIVEKKYFEVEQIKTMIKNGEIKDAYTLAAMCLWNLNK